EGAPKRPSRVTSPVRSGARASVRFAPETPIGISGEADTAGARVSGDGRDSARSSEESRPSLSGALHHVLVASQRVVVSHMDLIRLEAREDLTNVVSAATLIIVGGVFLVGLLVMLEALLVQALHQRFSV